MWEDCPSEDDFIGPSSGTTTVRATDHAIYCVMFNENQTFAEAFAAKAMLRIAPGNYPLQTHSGVDVMLPTCIRSGAAIDPSLSAAGPLTYTTSGLAAQVDHSYAWTNPVANGGDVGFLQTHLDINVAGPIAPLITLDGSENDTFEFENVGRHTFYFCEGDPDCGQARVIDSCTFDNATLNRHTLALNGGNVIFDLRIGESFASTEPGAFVAASGTWQGEAFDQRDYFKLIYVPEHHHFRRSFIVLFDQPIDGACGLRVSNLAPWEEEWGEGDAATVDCDLQDIAAVTITDHSRSLPQ